MSYLKITTFQAYLFWENAEKNLQNLDRRLGGIREKTDLIVLPEMFNTGFSMNTGLAEEMDGATVRWMEQQARRFGAVVTGSVMIRENGKFYNRMIWMKPDGSFEQYDKRHLFGLGKEDDFYTAGTEKKIFLLNGWRIFPAICYDLRFPVWMRNAADEEAYDLILLVANWPEKRKLHWKTLIPARAVENQAYIVAVNRVGHDGNEIYHNGDSMCIDPNGNVVYYKPNDEDLYTFTINREEVVKARRLHPFLKDADSFKLL